MIRYRCPHCAALTLAHERRVGQSSVCKACLKSHPIPSDTALWLTETGELAPATPAALAASAPRPPGAPGPARQIAAGAVVFVATFLLLAGIAAWLGSRPPSALTPGPSTSLAAGAPTARPSREPSREPTVPPSAAPTASDGPTGDPILIGAGDIADCTVDDDEATARLLDDLPGTVFTAGDNAYDAGTADEFAACFDPTWGRHLARIRPAPGNHDWATGRLDGYLGTFGQAATGPGGTSWYAYDLGTWHIVVLDSECERVGGCGTDSAQGTWLAADLAASSARCTLAIWHIPRFSSGMHGDDERLGPFWETLYAAGADVIVNGHDHDYERFAPQDPDGAEDRTAGIREFIVGTGGRALRPFERVAPNSELRASLAHGLLEFTLRDGGYDWRFIPATGDFSDRGSARCH